tara:strand:+ start:519 stop:1088 length:570 start_codon:yes stop_codon:yes gene_type:complete
MKIFLSFLIFILSFQSLSQADDLKNFEIEGMSIGESALNFFSKKQIDNGLLAKYNDNTYTTVEPANQNSNKYDYVSFSYRSDDNDYKMVAISGVIRFKDSINDCHKLQDQIFVEIKELFPSAEVTNAITHDMQGQYSGSTRQTFVELIGVGFAAVQCYNYDKDVNRDDIMRVQLINKIYNDWLINKAFK